MAFNEIRTQKRGWLLFRPSLGRYRPCDVELTATFGTASFLVLQQVQSATSFADGSPLPALPQPSGLLFGVHPELLGVAPIHLETTAETQLADAGHQLSKGSEVSGGWMFWEHKGLIFFLYILHL